ncbi:diguanylate cyclase [Methylomonas sp. LL1]|uniref:GGDEF domain-containing protein n=1 Tax=Methylomonas sp. LL1 TaxID=2785785 RepID=UPI0018C362F8|nr:GGDEF domain-containing protein [Methylomonas sp. LL1]QPK62052.1 diguanylate cyclase [Methylomonas sp. LL1]
MGFSKIKDGSPQHWKEKYFKLLDSQEQAEKNYQANEDLLCKTIVRFALAVKGFNKSLDPHLDRIRDLLKTGVQSQRLQKELQVFTNALMVLEETPVGSQGDTSMLFDFLGYQYPDCQTELQTIQKQYDGREIANPQRLFLALAELIDEKHQDNDGFAAELALADSKTISEHMIRLLDSAELPDLFADDAKQLKIRLQDGQALGPVFNDAVTLLLSIKKHMEVEQQEMADFLSTLTEELAELGLKTSGVNIANEDTLKKRSNLDRDVAAQMADLQKKSATATQLEPLKQLISTRLHSISQQLQTHTLQEQVERDRTQRELRALMQKLREMESETLELQSRLDLAQRRATRDSLTGLPNRLAFEERLADEVARARRYGTALTLAVWDIDFFKNINDTYGHKSGDKALVIIAKLLSRYCREADFVARFGGEEFVMLLPETEARNGLVMVDKLREIVERSGFNANGDRVSITLSCGLSQYVDGDNNESLFVRADGALYQAKQSGRNQCVLA